MKTLQGNILDIDRGVLVHQVNTLGIMGGGLAFQIREKWPLVYRLYREAILMGNLSLGQVHYVTVGKNLVVANLAGQSTLSAGECVTDYGVYPNALDRIRIAAASVNLPVYIPRGIGCGLAGGDWDVMRPLIERHLPDATIVEFQPEAVPA